MKTTVRLPIAYLSTWAIFFLVAINAAGIASADMDCTAYQSLPPAEAIQRINEDMKDCRESLADYENLQKNNLVHYLVGARPIDEIVRELLMKYVDGTYDLEEFENKILAVIRAAKMRDLMIKELHARLENLSRCHTEITSTMNRGIRQERIAALNALTLTTEVAESEQLSPFPTSHVSIEKSEMGVVYEIDSPTAKCSYSWSLSGVPQTLEPGHVFTITMNGNASGKTSSAGGGFAGAILVIKGGLKLMSAPAQNKVLVGIPQTGKPARPGQVASNSAQYQFQLTDGSNEATLEFRVGHGSGSKLVATYSWR